MITGKAGDVVLAGHEYGKVRALVDEMGRNVKSAGPSIPAEILGLNGVPEAGDEFVVVSDERKAREVAEFRRDRHKESQQARQQASVESMLVDMGKDSVKMFKVVLKTDVRGSSEAIRDSLQGLGTGEVKVKVIHAATGPVSESDVMLAGASDAIILAFNVRTDPAAASQADINGVEIRTYEVIYQLLESVEQALEGLYEPVYERVVDGVAEVRALFRSSRVGQIAGCYVTEGQLLRGDRVRVLRDGAEVADAACEGLRRFQDDVREVQQGFECGVVLERFDAFEEGDLLEFYHQQRVN